MRHVQLRVRWAFPVALAMTAIAALVDLQVTRGKPVEWDLRVTQRQQLRWMSAYITAYAREYGRPAFYPDSVIAHLDSATAAQFTAYLKDVWGDKVWYWWNEQTFELSSAGGISPWRSARMQDSIRALRIARGDTAGLFRPFALAKRLDIREEYWWPVEARGRRNSWGQYTREPGFNQPILIQARPLAKTDPEPPPELARASL
jgi:hypothetical protein